MGQLILTFTAVVAAAMAAENPLVLRGVTIIDCTGGESRREMDVLLAGVRIVEVGPKVRAPKDAEKSMHTASP